MRINFYFSTMEEARELEGILNAVAKQHFNPYDYSFTTVADAGIIVTGYTQIHLKSEAYFKDLDKAKDLIREQAREKDWQYLKKDVSNKPKHHKDVLVRTPEYPNINSSIRVDHVDSNGNWAYVESFGSYEAWKEIDFGPVIFKDFCEDVLENLSFVPKVFIE